jgi:hypothetical protein
MMFEKWQKLFNGRDLKDWTPKIVGSPAGVNFGDTFRVENGMISVRYDQYGGKFNERFGHLFYKTQFSHYRIRAEYRFVGQQLPDGPGWATRNSGLMLHGQTPESMTLTQDFPCSIEVQLLGGLGNGKRSTANLCTPGTNVVMKGKLFTPHCTDSSSDTFDGDQWVTCEVEVLGSESIKHFINGKLVLEYTQPQIDERDGISKSAWTPGTPKLLERGTISLQSESHPVDFRKVEILDLSRGRK